MTIAIPEPEMGTGTSLSEQMSYARAVSSASMLPDNYRGKPADIMLAVGLGQSMGLSPAESLYRISVIKGKPTAGAELIAANVRKAGHKLRVSTDDKAQSVTATILRADDPEFPFEVTRDMGWAQKMGLDKNDNYRKQPLTMLQWRAITAVARLACPEALYGVAYTADEVGDMPATTSAPGGLAAAMAGPTVTAEQVEPERPETGEQVTAAQLKKIGACMGELGLKDRAVALEYVATIIGRTVGSRNELTKAEAGTLIDALEADVADAADAAKTDDDADYAAAIGAE